MSGVGQNTLFTMFVNFFRVTRGSPAESVRRRHQVPMSRVGVSGRYFWWRTVVSVTISTLWIFGFVQV